MNALLRGLEHPLAEAVGWALLHFLWQGLAVVTLLALSLAVLRRRSAQARYVVCCAALAAMGVLPVATTIWCRATATPPTSAADRLPMAINSADSQIRPGPLAGETDDDPDEPITAGFAAGNQPGMIPDDVATAALLPTAAANSTWHDRVRTAIPWCVATWLCGVLILSVRLLAIWSRVQRLRRVGVAPVSSDILAMFTKIVARLRISRPVKLLQSTLVEVPTVIGWLRPVILLPIASLAGLTPLQVEAILIHELAHIRRWDYLVNLLQNVVETLLFYHPAVWWASGRIRQERENCCDDLAAAMCGDRVGYAEALVRMEELRAPWGHVAVAARGGNLLVRVRRLLAGTERDRLPPWWQSPVAALVVVAGLVAGFWSVTHVAADSQPTVAANQDNDSKADAEPALPQYVIRGIVRGPDGRAVDKADVWLVNTTPTASAAASGEAHSVTDANGQFALPLSADAPFGRTNSFNVIAHKPGVGIAHSRLGGLFLPVPTLVLTMVPTAPVTMSISNPQGMPLRNAKARVMYLTDPEGGIFNLPEGAPVRFVRTSDARGEVTFDLPRSSSYFGLDVEAPRYGRQMISGSGDGPNVSLQLSPVGKLRGRLIADDPKQTGGAQLRIQTINRTLADSKVAVGGFADFRTEADGRFEVPELAVGELHLMTLDPRPGSSIFLTGHENMSSTPVGTIEPGKTLDIDVPVVRGGRVSGTVIDEGTLEPFPGAHVHVSVSAARYGTVTWSVLTDKAGRYDVIVPPGPGRGFVQVGPLPAHFLPAKSDWLIAQSDDRNPEFPAAGETLDLPDFPVRRGITLSGTVVDSQQRPVARRRVQAGVADQPSGHYHRAIAETDSQGKFTIGPVDADLVVALIAADDTRAVPKPLLVEPWKTSSGIVLSIDAAAMVELSGRVVDRDGKPLADASILGGHDLPNATWECEGIKVLRPIPSSVSAKKTDKEGKYVLPGRVPIWGRYSVQATLGGYVTRRIAGEASGGPPGQQTLADLVLEREPGQAQDIHPATARLFIARSDGSESKPLDILPEYVYHGSPRWSPDGKRIVFNVWKHGEDHTAGQIAVANADGTSPRVLIDGLLPSFSPKGDRIAFSRQGPNSGVWVMGAERPDTDLERIDANGWGSDWSPDGKLVYSTATASGANLVVFDRADGSRRLLFDEQKSPYKNLFWNMAWAPDGRRIVFKGLTTADKYEVGLVDARGAKQGLVHRLDGEVLATFAWSPDGSRVLLCKSCPEREHRSQIYTFNPDTNDPPQLLAGQDPQRHCADVAWSPDGKQIAVSCFMQPATKVQAVRASVSPELLKARFVANFRGKRTDPSALRLIRGSDERYVALTDEGLKMDLPAGEKKPEQAGISTEFLIRGDFELTAVFHSLKVHQPAAGWGAGLDLLLQLGTGPKDFILIERKLSGAGESVFATKHGHVDSAGKYEWQIAHHPPNKVDAGKIRVVRKGNVVYYLFAEYGTDDYQLFDDKVISAEDVRLLKFVACANDREAGSELLLEELEIHAAELPGLTKEAP